MLRLTRLGQSYVYMVRLGPRFIGRIDCLPIVTKQGMKDPPLLMFERVSEPLLDRIKDLVNKRDGTNRDVEVHYTPDRNKIRKHMERRQLTW